MVVRMRRNHSQTAQRRSHHALRATRLSKCECGAMRLAHRACPSCGKYNGRVVIDVVARAKRAARRTKRRGSEKRLSGQGESGQAATSNTEKETTSQASSRIHFQYLLLFVRLIF